MKKYLPSGFVVHPLLVRFILAGLFLFSHSIASAQAISIVSGNGQLVCSQCPTRPFTFDPLVVIVKDARGNPVPNAIVSWTANNDKGVDGRVTAASTTTGPDGTSSNNYFVSSPIQLLTPFMQGTVTASAMGSSVTFTETNGAATNIGIAQISSNLQSPIPGTTLAGSPGSIYPDPVRVAVSSFFPAGPVAGAEIRVESDPAFPATAACSPASVLTNAAGIGVCNLQFGNTTGEGRIKVHVGNNYDVYGPIHIQVGSGPGTNPGPPPVGPPAAQLSATPSSLSFVYPGAVTQTISVVSSSGPVSYTAAVQVSIAQVSWLAVGAPSAPAAGTGQSTFPVTILPNGLQVGTYRASIAVHPGNGTADIIIPVQLTVQSGTGAPGPTGPPATSGQLSATPSSLTLQYPGPVSQTVSIASSGGAVTYTVAIQMSIALVNWLAVGTPSGPAVAGAPSTFQVSIVTQSLQPGTYRTSILVHPDNGTADLTIPVLLTVQAQAPPTTIAVSPPALNVSSMAGAPASAAGPISVTGTGPSVPFNAVTNGASWLTISSVSGATPGQIGVSVNPAGLQPGNYAATISVTGVGAANGPVMIPVNLSVQPAQNLTVSANSLSFVSQVGSQAPPAQTIAAAASNGSLAFTAAAATISPPGGNWLLVSPPTGTAGAPAANLTVSVNPAGLAAGTYTGMLTLTSPNAGNSPQAINVTYTITALPAPALTTISNAASSISGAISPGEIISIYGNNLGPPAGIASTISNGSVQTLISETQVTFDNIPAPLLYVSATQINTIVPYEVAGRVSTRVTVVYKNTQSLALTLNLSDSAPGIFVTASGQGLILNEDGTVNDLTNPAPRGSVIVFYGTGEGVTSPFGTDGAIIAADATQLKKPVSPVAVTIGGYPAEVQYAGSAPGMVTGALQVNVVVPDAAPSGTAVPIVLAVGANSSPAATMAIQ